MKSKKIYKIPLSKSHPDLAKEWHPTKNGELTSKKVTAGSGKKAWWKCSKGNDHEWQARIVDRAKANNGCPYCEGKKVSKTNSLLTRYPELAKEWHPTKNRNIKPSDIFGGGHKKYWWKCSEGDDHEWDASINKRAMGRGCPICRGLKVVKSNCLTTTHPDLAKEWHPSKNGNLTPPPLIIRSAAREPSVPNVNRPMVLSARLLSHVAVAASPNTAALEESSGSKTFE